MSVNIATQDQCRSQYATCTLQTISIWRILNYFNLVVVEAFVCVANDLKHQDESHIGYFKMKLHKTN